MTGCRHNAKNTLVKNYLYLAEQHGAGVHPLTTVTRVRPLRRAAATASTPAGPRPSCRGRRAVKTFTAEQVVFAAAALGTQKLLHRLKDEGDLPRLSDRLGLLTRTNSESILGAIAPGPSTSTTARASRSPRRSTPTSTPTSSRCATARAPTSMSLLQTVLTDGDGPRAALADLAAGAVARSRRNVRDLYDFKHWSERTVIALVMQTLDNSITTFAKQDAARLA